MQCATHPSVETELACGKCGKPICPRCMVQTPVGARCRECANVRKLPQYELSLAYLARGVGAALIVGVGIGGIWGFVLPWGVSFLFGLIVGLGVGYVCGESVALATNRKQAPMLQWLAAGGVVVAYLVRSGVLITRLDHIGVTDFATNDFFGLVVTGLAIVVAMSRLR